MLALNYLNEGGRVFFQNWGIAAIRGISYYFLMVNAFYILLLILAVFSIRKKRVLRHYWDRINVLDVSPSISILAPAYNEQLSIEDSVQALCHLRYMNYEVIVINDGSKDGTLQKLKDKFKLHENILPRWSNLSSQSPRGTYRSNVFPNLIVIDKENSGKASSLNLGIDYASTELICCVDSDSLLDADSLSSIAAPFLEDPTTIASGGTIRVVNGSETKHARVVNRHFPSDFLSRIQFLEYIRAFFCGRVGWNSLNCTLIISGAFGVFKKSALLEVGGYKIDTLAEDMDLVVRLHAHYRKHKIKYRILFLAEPVCWTEVPSDWRTLGRQRRRWALGLFQVLWRSKRLFLNPRYGTVGMVAFPYFLFVDLLSPFFEFTAFFLIIWGGLFGYFQGFEEILLFFTSIAYGSVVTFAGAMIDDSFDEHRLTDHPSLAQIFIYSVLENFGYRQIHAWWRIEGFFQGFKKKHTWGEMVRKGVSSKLTNN